MSTRRPTRREILHLSALGASGLILGGCSRQATPSPPPLPDQVNGCILDAGRLAVLRDCMQPAGPESPRDEWDHTCIHPHTGAYTCGRLAVPGGPNDHDHDPEEVARCRKLADEAGAACRGVEVNLSEGSSELLPFFVTANRPAPVPNHLTADVVRSAFGGSIYPAADIVVEPLAEKNRGWMQIADSEDGELQVSPGAEQSFSKEDLENLRKRHREDWEKRVQRWREITNWFRTRDELREPSFVLIGDNPLSETNFGCVFPRLVVGLTKAGSLVGVCGHAVHT